jgi:hypothetical protein
MTLTMHEYEPGPAADGALLRWWLRLAEADDLDRTFGPGAQAIGEFFAQMRHPDATLVYGTDADGAIRLAFKLNTILGGAFVVLWVDPAWRTTREALATVAACYGAAFRSFPVLLGVTAQPGLLDEHQKWGYIVVGRIPALYGTSDAWLVTLTESDFLASHGAQLAGRVSAARHDGPVEQVNHVGHDG